MIHNLSLFKKCVFTLVLLLTSQCIYAQQMKVSGTVLSKSDGETLIGATVKEVGTSNGVITDLDGHFAINVKKGAKLHVSYVGFTGVDVAATPNMKVMLEDVMKLNEVVVVGYQTARKADLTGDVGIVDMKKPISESNPNILNSLQGKVPGVMISTDAAPGGGGTSIRVRGMSTMNGNDPLYIIDGVPTTENLNSINSADIECIT